PLIGLTLALNFAISGSSTWSYHAFNLAVLIVSALALFGIVRRTLLTERLRQKYATDSMAIAAAVALVWVVHPLLTQSVTYVIQRCESLMGMFYFLTLYCSIRSASTNSRGKWYAAAISASAAGMLSKEVMLTAPIVVAVYDVLFLSGKVRQVIARRWPLYAGLAATWVLLAATMISAPVNNTAGFAVKSITPWEYFKSELAVIVHYIRLSLWPDPLVLDYAWPKALGVVSVLPYAIIVGGLAGATLFGLVRRRPAAFLGVWFFFILSLTSTFVPFADLAFEHRMFLPLAAIVSSIVLGGHSVLRRPLSNQAPVAGLIAKSVVVIVVGVLAFSTSRRNLDYRSSLVMWSDVVNKRPENGRARNNLGLDLLFAGRLEESEANLIEAIRLNPQNGDAFYNLGRNFMAQGRYEESIPCFIKALQIDPTSAEVVFYMGMVREKQGRLSEAIRNYDMVVEARPNWTGALNHIALVLATQTDPSLRNVDEATALAERAVALTNGKQALPLETLATVYAEAGRFAEAISTLEKARAVADSSGDSGLAARLSQKLEVFRSGHVRPDKAAPQQ
ncbi:MAG TPA: tetratricopeptide repeat protein, partial [Blastocatellia bacterium]|nr:tetratricopeptide repeat protein [Blastocatellia bacterium]